MGNIYKVIAMKYEVSKVESKDEYDKVLKTLQELFVKRTTLKNAIEVKCELCGRVVGFVFPKETDRDPIFCFIGNKDCKEHREYYDRIFSAVML